jgi:MFS transporter, ENTS family, enterobactin (siderophore) exporter
MGAVNRFFIDLGPLRRSRDFRPLFTGQMLNMLGNQLAVVAIPFQVYELTRSSLQVGAVSSAQLVPLVMGALVGGSVADAFGSRAVMIATALAMAVTSGALAVNAGFAHPSVVVIYVASGLGAGMGGAYSTACTFMAPALLPPDRLLAAFATMQVVD